LTELYAASSPHLLPVKGPIVLLSLFCPAVEDRIRPAPFRLGRGLLRDHPERDGKPSARQEPLEEEPPPAFKPSALLLFTHSLTSPFLN